MKKAEQTVSSGNVFTDLGFPAEEAQNLLLRARVMGAVKDWFEDCGLTQASAAKKLAITQPRLNALLKGKIGDFSLDALVAIASSADLRVALQIKPMKKPAKPRITPSNGRPAAHKRNQKVA